MPFCTAEQAIEAIRNGQMIIVCDDEDRENEGDLCVAAEFCTADAINFMAKFGRGLICLSLTEQRLDYLQVPPMSARNETHLGTAFHENIDARDGITTGISAADRARTIQIAIDPATQPRDLVRPGHIPPLQARNGGVLVRAGQTEAGVDLARLAGLVPASVICEIMSDDGTMARVPELEAFCAEHSMLMLSVAELIRYRLEHEKYVESFAEGEIETKFGLFRTIAYRSAVDDGTHLALVHGDVDGRDSVLVRVHTHDLFGDVFHSTGDVGQTSIEDAMRQIAQEGRGALLYLHQSAPGFGLRELAGAKSQIIPHPPPPYMQNRAPDGRNLQYRVGIGAQIIRDLGLGKIRLLTNHPRKVVGLEGFGIEIEAQIPVAVTTPQSH